MCYNHTDNQLHWRRMEENILCFTVILADDEPQILEGIRDSVEWETLGFHVIATALNGNELLEQTETLRPDLVISDIKMPFLDGLEVARILHENMMHIKIVLFSGWDDFEYAQLAIRYGVSEYVLKPIDFQEMPKPAEKNPQRIRNGVGTASKSGAFCGNLSKEPAIVAGAVSNTAGSEAHLPQNRCSGSKKICRFRWMPIIFVWSL